LILACAFVSSSLLAQTGTQAGGYDKFGHPECVNVAKPEFHESNGDASKAALRQARSLMFNTFSGIPLIAHDPGDKSAVSGGGADYGETNAPIPTKMSDVAVIATALSFQPFLSADKSMVYTELATTPYEILKDRNNLLVLGEPFVILQRGGTLQLSDGKVVNSIPYGGSNPIRTATRYMLFLRYHPNEQAFTVIRAWDLSRSKPREMDNDGHDHIYRPGSLEDEFSSEDDLKAYMKTH
jgi:hypothetical protein